MNPAVDLVEDYLHWNGYFTVIEYPVHRTVDLDPGVTQATDIDILAVRLARQRTSDARSWTTPADPAGELVLPTDPDLGLDDQEIDVIIGEVKEGEAAFNPGLLDPAILHAVIDRVGCCSHDEAPLWRSGWPETDTSGSMVRHR